MNEDYLRIVDSFPFVDEIRGCRFVITGATGLIGRTLVKCLVFLGQKYDLNLSVCCPVRNKKKALELLPEAVELLDYKIEPSLFDGVDYVVHGACPTSSRYFVEHPVETFDTIVSQTLQLLNSVQASKSLKGIVYLSSLESYGIITDEDLVYEERQGYIDPMSVRSCYSMGKRAAETLCHCYAKEYEIPVRIARLTQTFGSHVSETDNRVYAQFARCVAKGEDIVLHTSGLSSKPYLFDVDAVNAILYILVKGQDGNVYNVANENTYMSVSEMAEFLCKEFNPKCKITFENIQQNIYAPETHLRLDTSKLRSLGWMPMFGKKEMFEKLINNILR